MRSGDIMHGTLLDVRLSRGDVYLASPGTRQTVGSRQADRHGGSVWPVFCPRTKTLCQMRRAARRIVGRRSDELDEAEIEIKHEGEFTSIEFDAGGREAKARVPTSWFGPATRGKDIDVDVAVRTVDVEKVTVIGPSRTQ
jgi:hypothetical protein